MVKIKNNITLPQSFIYKTVGRGNDNNNNNNNIVISWWQVGTTDPRVQWDDLLSRNDRRIGVGLQNTS